METVKRILTYHHDYHQAVVYKIYCAQKPNPLTGRGTEVYTTFEECLQIIQGVHAMSLGMRQIVYMVGWQYGGHDSKYPDWSEFNESLKRPGDASARDSFLWLCEEAKRYNAVVSVHICMDDAFENSPLWDEYVRQDLIIRETDGTLRKGGVWGGEQAYLISKTREWQAGFAQKRLDRLMEMLPLREAGTVHIDVFQPNENPYYGITREMELETLKEILLYLNNRGVDVTKEWFHTELIGYIPMAYHFNWDERHRLAIPPHVACGGGDLWNVRRVASHLDAPWAGYFTAPGAGCVYERAWGISIDRDLAARYRGIDWVEDQAEGFKNLFYLRTLPWYFLNRLAIEAHVHTVSRYAVEFSGGVLSAIDKNTGRYTLRQNDRLLMDGDDLFMPALWTDGQWIAYSRGGGAFTWDAPGGWTGACRAAALGPYGDSESRDIPIRKGKISFSLEAMQALTLQNT